MERIEYDPRIEPLENPGTKPGVEPEAVTPTEPDRGDDAREAKRAAKEARARARRERAALRVASRNKAVKGVFTGSILGSDWVRKMWPYLLCIAVVLVAYIAFNFHVQQLHLERQRLEGEVRELGIEAVERTAERVRQTRRSAIVERLRKKNIPLEEFPHPVKKIER